MEDATTADGEVRPIDGSLDRISAELKRFNDRFEPEPWYKALNQPIGYGLVGLVLLILAIAARDSGLATASSGFFIAQAISSKRPR